MKTYFGQPFKSFIDVNIELEFCQPQILAKHTHRTVELIKFKLAIGSTAEKQMNVFALNADITRSQQSVN